MRIKRILSILLVVALLLVVIGLLAQRFGIKEETETVPSPNMEDLKVREQVNQQMAEAMSCFSMNLMPLFPDGTAKGTVQIQNAQDSGYSFTVEISSSLSGESVFCTGLIDPGYYVATRALDKPLPAGTYPSVATITAYDAKTQQKIGSVGLQVVLRVEK